MTGGEREPRGGLEPSGGELEPSGGQLEPSGGQLEPSGLGPMGDVHLVAAMLRADRDDVESLTRVLTASLAGALPAGMVEVARKRGLADRMAGRDGRAEAVLVHGDGRDLELRQTGHGGVRGELRQVVRGVVISRREIGVDEWLTALAEDLMRLAARNSAARDALTRLLGR